VLFFVTGCLHPQEIMNLVYGVLYLVTLPGGYVLLVIYSICNLHIVTWGTREDAGKKKKNNGPNKMNENHIQTKRGKIATYFMGDGYEKKGLVQNVSEFFQHLLRPSSNRQEQILLEICHRLESLRDGSGSKNGKTPLSAANTLVDNATPSQMFFPRMRKFDLNNNTINSTVMETNLMCLESSVILSDDDHHLELLSFPGLKLKKYFRLKFMKKIN
jgi:hypothetical protein